MLVDPSKFSLPKIPAFLVIDGANGAGKTTLQNRIADWLQSHGIRNIKTREPGGTPVGQKIRALVLEPMPDRMCDLAEMFLFAADRADHVAKIISPALKSGTTVISDRYYYSTVAFQGYGRGINRNIVEAVNIIAIGGVLPDLTIVLDIDPVEGLRRNHSQKSSTGREDDAFEDEEIEFHSRLRQGFLELSRRVKEPCIVVNAMRPQEEVFNEIVEVLERSIANS